MMIAINGVLLSPSERRILEHRLNATVAVSPPMII